MNPKLLFMNVVEKSINNEKRQIDMIANCGTVDRTNELVHPSAWKKTIEDFMKNPVLLDAHNYREASVGKFVDLYVKDNALCGRVEFAPTEAGMKYWALYSGGYQRAFSVGFIPNKAHEVSDKEIESGKATVQVAGEDIEVEVNANLRTIFTDIELLETSCVPVPCNRESLSQLAIRSLEGLKKTIGLDSDDESGDEKKICSECGEEITEDENVVLVVSVDPETKEKLEVVFCKSCHEKTVDTEDPSDKDQNDTSDVPAKEEGKAIDISELKALIADGLEEIRKTALDINENILSLGNAIERNGVGSQEDGNDDADEEDEKKKEQLRILSNLKSAIKRS